MTGSRPLVVYATMMYPTRRTPGQGATVVLECAALRSRFDVVTLCLHPWLADGPPADPPPATLYVPFLSYPGSSPLGPKAWSCGIAVVRAGRRVARTRRPSVLVAVNPLMVGDGVRALAGAFGCPYVVSWHGAEMLEAEFVEPALRRRLRRVLGDAAVVVVNGEKLRRRAEEVGVGGTRVRVVPRPLPPEVVPERLPDRAPSDDLRLLTVASLTPQKGHAETLRAIARLRADGRNRNVRYVVVGEGPCREELAGLARGLGIADAVRWLGYVPPEQLTAHYSDADIFVMPSWSEGFGLVYLEAMAHGLPVIGCIGQGPADFVRPGIDGLLVPARDEAALADAIAMAAERRWDAAAIAAAARAFTVDAFAECMGGILSAVRERA